MPLQRTYLRQTFVAPKFMYLVLFLAIFPHAFGMKESEVNVKKTRASFRIFDDSVSNQLVHKKVDTLGLQHNRNFSTSSELSAYTLISPEIYDGYHKKILRNTLDLETGQHIPFITLTYYHKSQHVYIDLKRNDVLLPDQHFIRYQDAKANSKYTVQNFTKTGSELCHYQGSIRGNPNSRAAISTCNGIINGIVFDSTDAYVIHAENNGTSESQHMIFRTSEMRHKNKTCGHKNDESNFILNSIVRHKRSNDGENSRHGPFKANQRSLYVELVIVVDNGLFRYFEEHMGKVHQYCKDVANIMNALYAPLNIFVVLMGVVVWNERDEIDFDNESRETLHRFLEYRRTKLSPEHPNDHAQLLTKNKFNDNIVGKAFVGPMCSEEKSGAVCVAHSPIIAVVANTMAHEMGHVFGMSHDSKECKCPDKKCIMSDTSSSFIQIHWSSCSIDSLNQAFSRGIAHCLVNKPTKLFSSSECGNGFVEPGEECDCGLPGFCVSNCCNPETCRLHSNATCGSGECCDLESCRLKKPGTACRIAENECDLSEFCTGQSEFCPKDVYKHDTAECENGFGYCYHGKCGSHDEQCRILWGTAAASSEQCYSTVNKRGDNTGNCGFDQLTKEIIKCGEEHAKCGKLQCNHPRNWQKLGIASVAHTWTSHAYVPERRKYVECRSALFDFSLHNVDPGMTPNGAKCGKEKMCLDQKCVSIAQLRSQGLGKTCTDNCNDNGFCNSQCNCHCNIGFTGNTCGAPGPGGSIDSGPATNPNAHDAFQRFLYIFFCGVIPLLVIFLALVCLYHKRYFKRYKAFKNGSVPVTEVVYASTDASTVLNPVENSVKQQLKRQKETARSIERLNRTDAETPGTSAGSIDVANLPKVHESIEHLAKTYRNSFISKSASNYELSTLSNSTITPPCANRKVTTPATAKKSYKSANTLATPASHSSNEPLRSRLEITDVRLLSSTNPLAMALSK